MLSPRPCADRHGAIACSAVPGGCCSVVIGFTRPAMTAGTVTLRALDRVRGRALPHLSTSTAMMLKFNVLDAD